MRAVAAAGEGTFEPESDLGAGVPGAELALAALQLAGHHHFGDPVVVDVLPEGQRSVGDAGQVEQEQAGDVVEVSLELLDGEVGLVAELAGRLLVVELLLVAAAVAVVDLLSWDLLQAVAGQVEAGVAVVAVEHLVGVVVEAAEADLAVRFEELLVAVAALGRPHRLLAIDQRHQHLHGLVRVAVLEVLEDCHPHQVLLYARDLLLGGRQRAHLLPHTLYEFVPRPAVIAVDGCQLLLPQHGLPLELVLFGEELERPLVLLNYPAEVQVLVDTRQRQFDFPELRRLAGLVGRDRHNSDRWIGLAVPFVFGVVGDGLLELEAGEGEGGGSAGREKNVDKRGLGEELVLAEYAGLRVGGEGRL